MNKYAVGVCPHDEDNEVKIIEAKSELEAMVVAVGNEESWGFEKGDIPFDTVDEGIDFYLQGDVAISSPVLISENASTEEFTTKEKEALKEALTVIYLDDSSDYINGLWGVVRAILGERVDDDSFNAKEMLYVIDRELNKE